MKEGNGDASSYLHPEAVSDLAQETARRQVSDRQMLDRLDEGMSLVIRQNLEIRSAIRLIANQVTALTLTRFLWPSFLALAVLALGGFAGAFLWLTLHR